MYQIESPIYFSFFLILPLILLIYVSALWWRKKKQKQFASIGLLNKLSPDVSNFKNLLKVILLSLGLSCIFIALVNPKMGTKLETLKREGVDIVFALDISKSMLAEDIAPNRLAKAKQIISKTIDQLGSDRIGIIAYAGSAIPLLPITTDHGAAKMFLHNATPDMVSSQGTAINEALRMGLTFYNDDEQTNRFLIIISDGEDHEEDAAFIVDQAADQGIKTYTVGVGTPNGGPIPIKSRGKLLSYKKDREGNTVITKLEAGNLEEIAKEGNGIYIDGNHTQKAVDQITEILKNAQKSEFESKKFSDYKDQFQWFLGFGILFLVLDVFLLEKKTKWIQKLNLFNEK